MPRARGSNAGFGRPILARLHAAASAGMAFGAILGSLIVVGPDMLATFRSEVIVLPVILYVGNPKPGAAVPAGAFGITNRPDVLLAMVGEALTRMGRG
jgi:hypothetical protein